MLGRLLIALLLVLGAMPATAMPAGCHDGPAMAMPGTTATDHHRTPALPTVGDHACVGCAAPVDAASARVAPPLIAPAPAHIVAPVRFMLRTAMAPEPRPPRRG